MDRQPAARKTRCVRVLIADDHDSFRKQARRLLEAEGHRVVGEAADGVAALAAAAELQPDLVLLDVQMPGLDGFEVAARLTRSGAPAPVVVLTSTRDGADYRPLVAACGARGFIAKGDLTGAALARLLS